MSTNEQTSVHFFVQAQCVDEKGQTVIRKLGNVRGPDARLAWGWTAYGETTFKTLLEAQKAAKHPYGYSVYDGHYKGGIVRVIETETHTVTTITTFEHPMKNIGWSSKSLASRRRSVTLSAYNLSCRNGMELRK
jgi:hypothetical protein